MANLSYEKSNVWLFNGDNVEFMRTVPEGVVDLTVTSPPYDDLRKYTGEGAWTFETFKEVAKELYRITAEGGVCVWNVNDKTVHGAKTCSSFKQALHFVELGFQLIDTMIWEKTGTSMGSNNLYHANFEFMFVLAKGKHKTFNPIKDRKNIVSGAQTVGGGGIDSTGKPQAVSKTIVSSEFGKRNNIWRIPPAQKSCRHGHPAPFPLQLAEDHIKSWSNEGDLIFDPFMGSGTVAVAAKRLKRRAMGCEIAKEYVDIQIARLEKDGA